VALLILTICARWGWVFSTMPWLLHAMHTAPTSFIEEASWASGPVWTCMERRKYLTYTRFQTLDRPAHRKYDIGYAIPLLLIDLCGQHFTGIYLPIQIFSNIQTYTLHLGEVYSLKMLLPS
jgi:hypothetical protein